MTLTLPLLPLRDLVVFPGTPMPLVVGRARSVAGVAAAGVGGRVLLVAQRRGTVHQPEPDDLFEVGTVAEVMQSVRLPDGNTKVIVEGRERARIVRHVPHADHQLAEVEVLLPNDLGTPEVEALARSVKSTVERYIKLNRAAPPDMLMGVNAITDPSLLADLLVGVLKLTFEEKQALLERVDAQGRLEAVLKALTHEVDYLQVEKKLLTRVKRDRDQTEREVWLDEQMRGIAKADKEGREDLDELYKLMASKELTEPVRVRAERELRRLAQMSPMSAEATVVRGYLDWLLGLPWTEEVAKPLPASEATQVLEEDHFGLADVKERILEHLAVAGLRPHARGPVLCLVGPPGVGKTSFARSIARATGRPFVRIALGGVRDEAEIRGHRRTYIGAMPGRIVQAMKRAGALDPVLLLDEVDKMASDMRGDPASALLEVLDPEQNAAFADHYLELDYDLSRVLFVCTANRLGDIPAPLLDRLEVIELSGYTEAEKEAIVRRYLLPRQREELGLTTDGFDLTDGAVRHLVRRYTRESGVRGLDRQLARLGRQLARALVEQGARPSAPLDEAAVDERIGPPRFEVRQREEADHVGLVQGLSVSAVGGELLQIEVAAVPGSGKLITTGRLGDVLKESATAVFTYVRSRAEALGLDADFHDTQDFHIHYPGVPGGVEGPSAGIAMATALVSALTGIPARSDTAMTGEITLRGRVLPVGGIKEKVLAAHRGGVGRVLLPAANRKDLQDVPAEVRAAMDLVVVEHMDQVLREALAGLPASAVVPEEKHVDALAEGGTRVT